MLSVQSVLWPTDGSEPSLTALEMALAICKHNGAKLYAVQVIPAVPIITPGIAGTSVSTYGFDVVRYEQELVKSTKEQMEQLISEKIHGDVDTTIRVLNGDPAQMINSFAEENAVDVIVMATQGHTGLAHLLLGSVAEKTIRHATCPVLIVPTEKKRQGQK
jgi:nucleotide-binding universal stress UspA family protein